MSIVKGRLSGVKVLLVVLSMAVLPKVFGQASLSELQHLVRQEPTNVQAWVDLGQLHLEARRLADAKDAFLEAIALEYTVGEAHFGLGLTEYAAGDYQAALFAFSEVTRLFPERFDGHFNRAVTLARLRRADEAVDAFREALANAEPEATNEDLVSTNVGLAGQLKRLSRYDEAAEAYQSALTLKPDDYELAYRWGEAMYNAGKGLEALPPLTELEGETRDYRVSALMADIYVEQGQVDYGLRALQRALRRATEADDGPAQANVLVKLGLLQSDLGRDSDALASFERAVRADSESWQASYQLGASYMELGYLERAQALLEDALALGGDSGELRLALAGTYSQLGQNDRALMHAEAARQRLSERELVAEAEFIVGRALYLQGDFRGARNAFELFVSSRPESAPGQLWAGLAEYALGEYQRAAQFYERAVQLDPDSVEARANLGAAYLASERYDDAAMVYDMLIEQHPDDAQLHYNLGWALLASGNREDARAAWQAAVELGYGPAQSALSQYF